MRYVLAPLRALILLLHILDGIVISGLLFPTLDQRRRNRIIGAWSRGLVRICGMRLVVTGRPLDPRLAREGVVPGSLGRLVLANHISWIDVFALLGTLPSRFVAKSEIGRWPLVGWLVTLVGTLYIERGRRHAVAAMNQRVSDRLKAGETIVVFGEGTTTYGFELLPFHSNLIAPALEVGCEIWPVALRYTDRGVQTAAAGFVGEMSLVNSLWNILVARDIAVEVACLPSFPAASGTTRHQLAKVARAAIANHLGLAIDAPPHAGRAQQAVPTASAPLPDDSEPEAASAPASASQ
ncbi:MAG TPA: lysophospholipid acyltransferase family protein [Burkholderiaceae bacterium]|nr:lysophospholipid acyltransferase family protein [Burkholderiaceae bacterium]